MQLERITECRIEFVGLHITLMKATLGIHGFS